MTVTLPYKVEYKRERGYFETIAAFDCEAAAVGYAGECALANMGGQYIVRKGRVVLRRFEPGV